MNRAQPGSHSIALLTTGDEVCSGDILNTNSQELAHRLTHAGMQVRLHLAAPDTSSEIESALHFLLQNHQAVILTGGLGPTSDDVTRFALSKVVGNELVFNEVAWQAICDRLNTLGYPKPPESNRQQALFPDSAVLLANPHGTAAGCMLKHQGRYIFMLPGPPNECLPMFDNYVLPTLISAGFPAMLYQQRWFLFGVSEGKIAEELDALVKPYQCVTGYRLFYPYLEFKIFSTQETELLKATALVKQVIKPYLILDGQHIASDLLKTRLASLASTLSITDHATGGALEATLKTPQNYHHLQFSPVHTGQTWLAIEGLNAFWQGQTDVKEDVLSLRFSHNNHMQTFSAKIPLRGKRVIQYAVEYICQQLYHWINQSELG